MDDDLYGEVIEGEHSPDENLEPASRSAQGLYMGVLDRPLNGTLELVDVSPELGDLFSVGQ
jgi:hypothetical protein